MANVPHGPNVDFDRLMLIIREHETGRSYKEWRSRVEHVDMPGPGVFVPPNPELLREHLDSPAMVLVNERSGGASTLALAIAHWMSLWSEADAWPGVHLGEDGPGAASASGISVWDRPTDAPSISKEALEALVGQETIYLVPLSEDKWPFCETDGRLSVVQGSSSTWYSLDDRVGIVPEDDRPRLRQQMEHGDLASPAEVRYAEARTPGSRYRRDLVAGRVEALGRAWAGKELQGEISHLVLVRLSQLPLSMLENRQVVEVSTRLAAGARRDAFVRSFLGTHEIDGILVSTMPRSVDREAVDTFISRHREALEPGLAAFCGVSEASVAGWFDCWDRCSSTGMIERGALGLDHLSPGEAVNYGSDLLAELCMRGHAGAANTLLDELVSIEHDFWSLREPIYSVLLRWDLFESEPHEFLSTVLRGGGSTCLGVYSVFEAFLYLQHRLAVPTRHRLLGAMTESFDELVQQPDSAEASSVYQAALIYDGLLWCEPRCVGRDSKEYWARVLRRIAEEHPRLWGAFAVSTVFHPQRRDILGMDPLDRFTRHDLEMASMAAWMIDWHFVHQSRGRALLSRRAIETEESRLLERTPSQVDLDVVQSERLVRAVVELAGARGFSGWAFHLGLNVLCTQGRPPQGVRRELYGALTDALHKSGPGDAGLARALVTYQLPRDGQLRQALDDHPGEIGRGDLRSELLGALAGGVDPGAGPTLNGAVQPPRFEFAQRPAAVHRLAGENWRELSKVAPVKNHFLMMRAVDEGLRELGGAFMSEERGERLGNRVAAGDYRPLAAAASLSASAGDQPTPKDEISVAIIELALQFA